MDDWKKSSETLLPEKEEFYVLNMENITDSDHNHANRISRDSEIKNLGEHHDLYLKRDTLLFADIFENFRKMF